MAGQARGGVVTSVGSPLLLQFLSLPLTPPSSMGDSVLCFPSASNFVFAIFCLGQQWLRSGQWPFTAHGLHFGFHAGTEHRTSLVPGGKLAS